MGLHRNSGASVKARGLSLAQAVIAIAALASMTVLALENVVSGDAVTAVVSAVLGGALGYVNGQKASTN
jgi:hypothetical protein